MALIPGAPLAEQVDTQTKAMRSFVHASRKPKLVVLLIGKNLASERYIERKMKKCSDMDVLGEIVHLEEHVSFEKVHATIASLNADTTVDGIILQMPLPEVFLHNNQHHTNCARELLDLIDPAKDVDGVTLTNVGKYVIGDDTGFIPATARAVLWVIDALQYDVAGKTCVMLGRSIIVGKPVSMLLLNRNATVITLHSQSKHIEQYTTMADVLISAVGKKGMVTADMVKQHALVIDVGISISKTGKLRGDVAPDVEKIASGLTPVPGGIGPLTVSFIVQNVLKAYCLHHESARSI